MQTTSRWVSGGDVQTKPISWGCDKAFFAIGVSIYQTYLLIFSYPPPCRLLQTTTHCVPFIIFPFFFCFLIKSCVIHFRQHSTTQLNTHTKSWLKVVKTTTSRQPMPVHPPPFQWKLVRSRREGMCVFLVFCVWLYVYMGFWSMYVLRDFFCVCVEKMPMRFFYIIVLIHSVDFRP